MLTKESLYKMTRVLSAASKRRNAGITNQQIHGAQYALRKQTKTVR